MTWRLPDGFNPADYTYNLQIRPLLELDAEPRKLPAVVGETETLIEDLEPGTPYYIEIMTRCPNVAVESWRAGIGSTDPEECLPPENPEAIGVLSDRATIKWGRSSGTRWVNGRVLLDANGQPFKDFKVPPDNPEIKELSPDTKYRVVLFSVCSMDGNMKSSEVSFTFTTAKAGPPPTDCMSPEAFEIKNISAVSATAQWNEVVATEKYPRIDYFLEYEEEGDPETRILRQIRGGTSWNIEDLKPSTNYVARIRTLCTEHGSTAWAYSDYTKDQPFRTLSCDPPKNEDIKAVAGYNFAKLTWPPVDFDNYSWLVRYRNNGEGQSHEWLEQTTELKDNKPKIENLVPDSPYNYLVITKCGNFYRSVPSAILDFRTTPCPLPSPESLEAKNITVTSAKLTWQPAGDANDVRYRKFCRDCSDTVAPWQEIKNVTDGGKGISGLSSGTKYEFQVSSVCADAPRTTWSPSATFRTLDCTTATPDVSVTNIAKHSALIEWPDVKGATYYQYRIKKEGGNYSQPIDLLINFQTLPDLEKCADYVVQVRSFCTQPGDPDPRFSEWTTKTFTTSGCVCENPMIKHAESCNDWFAFRDLGSPGALTTPWEIRWATQNVKSNQWRFHWQECGDYELASCTGPITTISNYTFRKEKTCATSSINRHVDYFVYGVSMTLHHYYRLTAQYQCDNGAWSEPMGDIYRVVLRPFMRVSNLTATGATVSWDLVPGATGYVISYGPLDSEPSGGISVGPTISSTVLKGLDPVTAYEVEVRAILPDGIRSMPAVQSITTASGTCRYGISPTSGSVGVSGGTGTVTVTADSSCSWKATSDSPWLTVKSGAMGSGNGTVTYSASANTGGEARTATLMVAGNAVLISQASGWNPNPAISNLNPTSATAGSGQLTLSVSGSGFSSSSVVQVNGSNRVTTFHNAGLLSAVIPSSDLVNPFTLAITVFNPAPGGGLSNMLSFAVTSPTGCTRNSPTVAISPADQQGYGAQQLTYRLTITNNDSPLCSVNSFEVRPSFPAIGWGQSPTSTSFTIMPGESASRDVLIWSPATAPYSTHTFRQTATSWLGPSGSGEATYTVYSLLPPDTCGRTNPTVTISPADQRGYGGQHLTYRVFVTNNDNPLCPVSGFEVTPAFPGPGWGQSPTSMGFVIAPGQTVWRDVSIWSSPGAAFTSHTFTQTATSGLEYSGSAEATYTVYDLMPPDTCGRANPTVTVTPNYQSGTQAQRLSYWVTVKNNDAPACGGSSFVIRPTMPVVPSGSWTHVPEDYFSLFAMPGESSTREINVISAALAQMGENTITWTASHTRYQSGSGQAIFNVMPYWEATIWTPPQFETAGYAFLWNRVRRR